MHSYLFQFDVDFKCKPLIFSRRFNIIIYVYLFLQAIDAF